MKKLLVMVLMVVLASASTALALTKLSNYTAAAPTGDSAGIAGAARDDVAGTITLGSTPFSVSTNVNLYADGDLGGYNCSSKHLSGDKSYSSSSVSASIFEATATKGTPMVAIIKPTGDNLYTGGGGY